MEDSLTESRGQKRSDMTEELPADKRACSSLEFRPSSSTVTPETLVSSTSTAVEAHGGDVETSSSSASASGHSEGDGDRDSPYGSCDSDDMDDDDDHRYSSLRALQRSRSYNDSSKFDRILSSLSSDAEPSGQLAALTELCELLSFCTDDSISSLVADQLTSALVKLAKHEDNPDIMLLAIRALTYSCDAFSRSSGLLVRHDAVPALCQKLLVIEYLDVAEQCLQALEKVSRDHPITCLQSGAIIAVLGYIDFFSTSVQRTALRTVVNICKELPSEYSSTVMDEVPKLCELLQYEDQQLVELVATCLIKVTNCVKDSPEKLRQLYDRGLINQVTHLLELNSRITLSHTTYTGLIELLATIASGSPDAVKTLFELNIGSVLKDGLSKTVLSHGTPSPRSVDNNCTQVLEILKLLHELLPGVAKDEKELLSFTERILLDHPNNLQTFGKEILSTLLQVVSSGANLYVCYGCLSVINRLVYLSKPETLLKLFEGINIASFLAGVFTRKDYHVLLIALQISDIILEKLSSILVPAFVKEGVLFAIDNLLMPDSCSQQSFPKISSSQSVKKIAGKGAMRCLCFAYHNRQLKSTPDSETCKADKDSVHSLAEHVKSKHFIAELLGPQSMVTDLLQDLRNASLEMNDFLALSPAKESDSHTDERLCRILEKIILQLGGNAPVSTFELIESGIMKALLNYLSYGHFLSNALKPNDLTHAYGVQKRFEAFARISLSSPDPASTGLPLSFLMRKLHSALSNVENFPVVAGFGTKQRGSYATVPSGRSIMHPCLKVRFLREEEELCLRDYIKDVVTVDPFCLVAEIEQYLRSKVIQRKKGSSESQLQSSESKPKAEQVLHDISSLPGKSVELQGSGSMCTVSPDMQEDGDGKSLCSAMETSNLGQTTVVRARVTSEVQSKTQEDKDHSSDGADNMTEISSTCLDADVGNSKDQSQVSSNNEDTPKLALYLDGEQLDYSSTLYQEILQRRIKSHHELHNSSKLWSSTYTVTYRRVEENESVSKKGREMHDNGSIDEVLLCQQLMPLFSSIFVDKLDSKLDLSSSSSDILLLLKSLEMMNRFSYHLVSYERMRNFAEGKLHSLDDLKGSLPMLSQYEFVNSRLTEKLEQQMRDSSAVHVGALPLWWCQLIARFPFLFGFEARCKFFQLAAFGRVHALPYTSSLTDSSMSRDRRTSTASPPRKKFGVNRERILESAAQMMDLYATKKVAIEVEYSEEVGTGLGPTLEFYTLVSHEFQKAGLGMWRGDYMSLTNSCNQQGSNSGYVVSTSGLFPRPWSSTSSSINGIEFTDVIKKFILLGQFVGKALQDGRVLDIPFSIAFYKLVLGKELSICDIQSFDAQLGRTLLEFKALASRQKVLSPACSENIVLGDSKMFRSTNVEDLCLDFTLPGYPDYALSSGMDDEMVSDNNLEEYSSLVLDATLQTGVSKQVEAFKTGLNQVISDKHLQIFTEEELERLLCGERDSGLSVDLFDHIKLDHGYTAGSPPVINLMEVISEFTNDQRRSFLQFVTGAPRLPPGGLAALNPKLTIVRKHSSNCPDTDLPSVMTCANYLKLPPFSSKEILKEKLLYAITEGQGSFHLS